MQSRETTYRTGNMGDKWRLRQAIWEFLFLGSPDNPFKPWPAFYSIGPYHCPLSPYKWYKDQTASFNVLHTFCFFWSFHRTSVDKVQNTSAPIPHWGRFASASRKNSVLSIGGNLNIQFSNVSNGKETLGVNIVYFCTFVSTYFTILHLQMYF